MSQIEMFEKPDEEGEVIYRMTITTKSSFALKQPSNLAA